MAPSKKAPKNKNASDYLPEYPKLENEFVRKSGRPHRESFGNKGGNRPGTSDKLEIESGNFTTPVSIDEFIRPNAKFYSYADFEGKFNKWRSDGRHPFRVASSETLRNVDGIMNKRFQYRYVVFHCACYGKPRVRGVGKRPKQNYLPCSCTAMMRLNYSFQDRCLKLTSLQTRHSNHELTLELYEKQMAKEEAKKRRQKDKKEKKARRARRNQLSEDRLAFVDPDASLVEEAPAPTSTPVRSPAESPALAITPVPSPDESQTPAPAPDAVPANYMPPPMSAMSNYLPAYSGPIVNRHPAVGSLFGNAPSIDYQLLQNQVVLNQLQLNSGIVPNWSTGSLAQASLPFGMPFQQPHLNGALAAALNTPGPSPTFSAADENEAPKTFTNLQPPALLNPIGAFSTNVKLEDRIKKALGDAEKLLDEHLPPDILAARVDQLETLISLWNTQINR